MSGIGQGGRSPFFMEAKVCKGPEESMGRNPHPLRVTGALGQRGVDSTAGEAKGSYHEGQCDSG